MKIEKAYDFRKELLQIHEKNLIDKTKKAASSHFEVEDGVNIEYPDNAGEVIDYAVSDFADFFKTSMCFSKVNIKKGLTEKSGVIRLHPVCESNADILGEANQYRGFSIQVNDSIEIYAYDERGMAQALYYLEDIMTFARAPFVEKGVIKRYPMFSPQMVHSGYGIDQYPDEHLARIAHEGRDAILLFVKDVNLTTFGELDFNDLIKRASRYGIDVYAYSYLLSTKSPIDDDAEEYYDNTYGRLFKECPGFKGVILVGESVEFPSQDPHVSPGRCNMTSVDGIPTGKLTSGWYPCEDYPVFLNLIKKVINKYKKDADIVFWTYNWGSEAEENRIKLIDNLPEGITLQATFEMCEVVKRGDSQMLIADYSISFEGPGKYFSSEGKAAKQNGIKLYSMTNTAGTTWDMGVIPYMPALYQWIRRYEAMRKAKDDWGLSGIMEGHHYGFYPSFLTKISKWAFLEPRQSIEDISKMVLSAEFGEENLEMTEKALELWSEAIRHHTPTVGDQYGAFRVGPSFPFTLRSAMAIPEDENAHFGNKICQTVNPFYLNARESHMNLKIQDEIKSLEKMYDLIGKGINCLLKAPKKNEKLERLINLGEFMERTTETGLRAKKWHVLYWKLNAADTKEEIASIIDKMEEILKLETENVTKTIPLVEADSRLGWEPSMLYMTDKRRLEWKLRQLDYMRSHVLAMHRKCLEK